MSRPAVPELLACLIAELDQQQVNVLDARAFPTAGLLCVTDDLTVWCYGNLLRWRHEGRDLTWPAADAYGAARRLAELISQTATQAGQQ